jgi:hypothetical protein
VFYDVDTYQAGFDQKDFPSQFGFDGDTIVVNDWLLRERTMEFASTWKFAIEFNRKYPPKDPIADSKEIQFQHLFDDLHGELEKTYGELLEKVKDKPKFLERFQKEHAAGDFPEEVYEHVAYAHLRDILRIESAYFALAKDQRATASSRQKAMESLLTLQRYEPQWRFFLMELTTRAELFISRAAVIDQVADPMLAFTYFTEQLNAVLSLDVYAKTDLYDRFSYAVLADELFDPRYLKEYQPAIYKELLQSDGTLKRVADLPRADQIRILRRYLVDANGNFSLTGTSRMQAVFGARIREDDFRYLADVIHEARAK